MSDALVAIENLTVRFEDRPVVDRVNLSLHRGDIITIIGPNGAGKTTLIKSILGIQAATSGRVIRTKNLVIGYVPQHLSLESTLPLSVKRFMLLSGRLLAECTSALTRTGVGHLLSASVHHLSGASNSAFCLLEPWPEGRTCWCSMSQRKVSILTVRPRFTILFASCETN